MADTYPKNTIDNNGLKKVWDMVMDRLNLKVDKEAGKGLSTNDYTTTEKNKLSRIESGAEVNTVTSVAGKTGAVTLDKSDVGLPNVGNFKAVSTSANQGLTDTEKSNARANIDTPSNGDIQSSKTLKSSVVTVNDAAPINAEDITVDITPIQDLHGYDRPWAGGAGKNKLDIPSSVVTTTINGITYTVTRNEGGAVTEIDADGTATADATIDFSASDIPIGNVILTGCPSGGGNDTWQIIRWNSGWGDTTRDNGSGVTYNNTTASNWFRLRVKSGVTVSHKKFYPMIRLATETDATFAPYSNECPFEGWTGAELDRVGKNRFDKNANNTSKGYKDNAYLYYNNVEGSADGWYISEYIRVPSIGSITLSGGRGNDPALCFYDADKHYINGVAYSSIMPKTFSIPSNSAYIRLSVPKDSKDTLQLELGATPTAYAPYQGKQYTASFGETVYGGKWHVTAGGTDKTHGFVEFDGSEDEMWTIGYSGTSMYLIELSNLKYLSNYKTLKCNGLSVINNTSAWSVILNNDYVICVTIKSNNIACLAVVVKATEANLSTFKTWLSNNPLQVVYELATPTTISTPKQNVSMLQGINTVYADCGDTSLKYQPDNVIGELKGEIEDNIIYEDFKWTTQSSQSYSAGTPGTYGTSSWRDVKKEGYDVIGVTFVENRRFGDCILTLYYIPSTSHVEVIIFRATSSAVTIADEDIEYRVAYKKRP